MEFSLMTEPHLGGTYDQQREAALWAEAEGLVSFARCDHFLSGREPTPDATDALAVLAGLARDTSLIRLCVLVTPITFRHPAVIAKNAATIDQMSEGRFDLGVGTGWMELEHDAFGIPFPAWPERWSRFEEALDYLDAVFADGKSSFSGAHYSVEAMVGPKPAGLRRIIGGGGKTRTPTLAGMRADEYNIFVCPPSEARAKIGVMRDAARGRRVEATMMGPALVGRTQREYRARLEKAAHERAVAPEDLEARYVAGGIPVGTPARVAETITALEDSGVERYYIQWLDLDDLDGMRETVSVVRGG